MIFQTAVSQTADEIIQNHIEAIGGKEKIKSIKTMIFEGSNKRPGKERIFKSYIVHDSAARTENTDNGIYGFGIVTKTEGWTYSTKTPGTSIKKKSKQELKESQWVLDLHGPLIDYKEKGNKVTYLGREAINNNECFKVRLVKTDKKAFIYYFDSTFFITRVVYLKHNWAVQLTVDYFYDKFQGFFFVTKGIRLEDGMEMTYTNYQVNPEIDRALFVPRKP